MMKLRSVVVALALIAVPAMVEAAPITFSGSYGVTANNSGPGLEVQTQNLLSDPFNIDLSLGGSATKNLFKIWTDEETINPDDGNAKDITVHFAFTAPPPPFGGNVGGGTVGEAELFGIIQYGKVTWDGPLTLNFGPNGDGILVITLSDEIFNYGFFGLNDGKRWGAIVEATFELTQLPTPAPEPASIALLGAGLLGLGFVRRRR